MPTLHLGASQGVKNPPANARDMGLIPGLGRHLAEGNLLQFPAWKMPWTEGPGGLVYGVAKNCT